jgi:hypothetical protein
LAEHPAYVKPKANSALAIPDNDVAQAALMKPVEAGAMRLVSRLTA